jgi:hypothetical protein
MDGTNRYQIVDNNGTIYDANGYGFTTRQKAHIFYSYQPIPKKYRPMLINEYIQ